MVRVGAPAPANAVEGEAPGSMADVMQVVFPDDWNGAFEAAPEIARLRERAHVRIYRVRPDNLADVVRDADIAVALRERTRYDASLLRSMANLKLIVSVGGRENPSIDKAIAMERARCSPTSTTGSPKALTPRT